jgi:hypothetical protein
MTRVLAILALVLACGIARAEPVAPRKIVVGVYVNHVYAVDIKQNMFTVDFYVWFRWEGDDLKPIESFELANGRITAKTGIVKRTFGTQLYASARVVATITKFWDLRRFPLDDHTLAIEIEDSEQDTRTAVFEADSANSAISPDLQVPGWAVADTRAHATPHTYRTNYGDISLAKDRESSYSRFIYEIDVERPGYGRFVKVFFGLFVSVLISWCAFWVRPKESSPRVSLGVGATFAAAAVTVTINNSLPDTNAVTMADKLIMLTLGTIVASLAVTIVALTLLAHNKEPLQKRLDRICAIVFPVVYLAMLVVIVA